MDRPLTEAQKRAIEKEGGDLCVTAGAGSGKTRILVERFAHLVLNKKVPVDRILAITFTEKAAAEMKERIAHEFEKRGKEKEHRQVEFAYISTIDAFCARLLRENALEAQVDPRFAVLEAFRSERLMEKVADEVLLGQSEDRLAALLEVTGIPDLSRALQDLHRQVRHAGMAPAAGTLEPPAPEGIGPGEVARAVDEIRRVLRSEKLTPRQREMAESQLRLLDELEAIPPSATVSSLADAFKRFQARIDLKGVRNDLIERALTRLRESLDRCLAERLEAAVRPCRELVGDLLAAFDAEYEKAKRATSSLDFADLEWKVRELLVRSPEIRERVGRHFLHVFLDEFQDTNPLQKEMIDLMRCGNCFFAAGDAKQSIYGFRDADVGIIAEFRKRVEPCDGHLPLSENFRSRREIIDFCNRLFSTPLWVRGAVPFEPMITAAEYDEKRIPSVEILLSGGKDADQARQREAQALTERIVELVERAALPITRKDSPRLGQPLSYGDVAILLRASTHMRVFERELAARQIPYFVQKGRGYFQTQEVRDLMNLLRVLENPRDDVHLAAVLRSPLCGLTDDDLYRLSRRGPGGKRGRLADRIDSDSGGLSETGRRKLLRFRELLRRLRSRKGQGPLWVSLESVLSRSELGSSALLHFNGRRRFANLRKLVELIRAWEQGGETSLPELVEILEDYSAPEVRESEAAVESPRDNTVKLMTIHAAKGLEFPLVILADLGRTERPRPSGEIFRRGGGLGIPLYDPEKGTRSLHSSSYRILRAEEEEAEKQEENRLLYVAVTRAQEHLILSGGSADSTAGRGSWMRAILEALGGPAALSADPGVRFRDSLPGGTTEGRMTSLSLEHRDRIRHGQPLPDAPEIGAAAAEAEEILRRVALPSPPPETTPYLATTTEIVQHHLCPRRYHLRYRIGAPAGELSRRGDLHDEGDSQEVKDDEVPAEVLGDRVHRILAEEPGSPLIDDLLATLSPRDRNDAERQIRTLRGSRFAREAAEGRAHREVPFAVARSGTTLRGQIDLVVERRDSGLLVVDYKTSRIGAGEVEEKAADYELQLRIYALAVKEIFGRLPVGAFLYFLHPDVIREVDLSVASLDRAEAAIAAYFDAHRAGEYPQRPARHCLSCGYRQAYCPNLSPGNLAAVGSPT